jgi:eukaryotic-like serine/threonine-protein kinase
MPHAATTSFFDGLRASRILDDARVDELQSRPEAAWGDVISLAGYAQAQGWLTEYQVRELQEGRGDRLAFNGYRIVDKLAESPAGVTYKALHPALMQPVSLRMVRPDWLAPSDTTAEYVARTRAASLVQSPHLANVLDAGTDGGAPFVVQEYVDGCDLFHLVNEMGALPVGLACEYTRQAALALKTAHDKGVAHGDVSPHTLLLTPVKRVPGSNGHVSIRPRPGATVKLADLALTPVRPPVGELTYGESDRLGAVAFYPPERLTRPDRDPTGDLYGLGATLYYLLTSRPPFAGNTPLEVMLNLQQAEPTPVEALRSDVPPAVADLVRRLLLRDPAYRPGINEVIETLLAYAEPSAMPGANAPDVPLANETFTQSAIPSAVPVARDLDAPPTEDDEPYAEPIPDEPAADAGAQPTVEPLPEVQPLDEHDGHGDQDPFGHSALGTGTTRAPRPRTKATKNNMVWIIAGLCLHLTAVILLIGWLTNWFSFSSKTEDPPPKVEKKDDTTPVKKKKRG